MQMALRLHVSVMYVVQKLLYRTLISTTFSRILGVLKDF